MPMLELITKVANAIFDCLDKHPLRHEVADSDLRLAVFYALSNILGEMMSLLPVEERVALMETFTKSALEYAAAGDSATEGADE